MTGLEEIYELLLLGKNKYWNCHGWTVRNTGAVMIRLYEMPKLS